MLESENALKNECIEITNELIKSIKQVHSLDKTLLLNSATFDVFNKLENNGYSKIEVDAVSTFSKLDEINDNFEYIIGILPIGLQKVVWVDRDRKINIKEKLNWLIILKSLFLLSKTGYGLFLVEPNLKDSIAGEKFIEELEKNGYYINAIFNTPEKLLHPETSLRPNFVLISKNHEKELFITELNNDSDISIIIDNFKNKNKHVGYITEGLFVDESNFKSFNKFKIINQLEKLSTQYKEFKKCKLEKISHEINMKNELKDCENSIYIPRVGNSQVISNLENAKLKHQNYVQVILKDNIVKAEYLRLFFMSEMGNLILKSLISGSIIQHINKRDIKDIFVPIPPLEEQNLIIETNEKLDGLRDIIVKFEGELALNPKNSAQIKDKLNDLLPKFDSCNSY